MEPVCALHSKLGLPICHPRPLLTVGVLVEDYDDVYGLLHILHTPPPQPTPSDEASSSPVIRGVVGSCMLLLTSLAKRSLLRILPDRCLRSGKCLQYLDLTFSKLLSFLRVRPQGARSVLIPFDVDSSNNILIDVA